MFYRTQQMLFTSVLGAALVECLAARPAAALLITPTVRLYTNSALNVNPLPPLASFTEATFDGYAPAAIAAWIGPVIQPPTNNLIHAEADFLAGAGIGAGQTCYGYFITDADVATKLYAAERFVIPGTTTPAPFDFTNPGDFLSIDVAFAVSQILQLNL